MTLADNTNWPVVVPGNLASLEGNSQNDFPFDLSLTPVTSQRYQQVYAASEFAGLPTGGAYISQISFRVDGNPTFGAAFASTLPSIQIDLSTTLQAVDGLSLTFADNVGLDDTIVFSRGALTLSGTRSQGLCPFDVTIVLNRSFLYDPANGNLLLDVRNFGGGMTTSFDAASTLGDGMSRVYTTFGADVNSLVANATGNTSYGLVTQFIFAVPEPSSLSLCVLAVTLVRWDKRRKQRRA